MTIVVLTQLFVDVVGSFSNIGLIVVILFVELCYLQQHLSNVIEFFICFLVKACSNEVTFAT